MPSEVRGTLTPACSSQLAAREIWSCWEVYRLSAPVAFLMGANCS